MVRKRSAPLTDQEIRELALRLYKEADPEEGPMDFEVGQLLDDTDLDLAAHNRENDDGESVILAEAVSLWLQGRRHPGHPRGRLRMAAVTAARMAGVEQAERWHVLDALERVEALPASPADIEEVKRLANAVELVAFLPADEPVHEADSYTDVLSRLTFDQLWGLAKGGLEAGAVFGSQEEWGADEKEAAAETLKQAMPSGLPPLSPADAAAMNWWRRLYGGLDPLNEDLQEISWEPGANDPDDYEPPMWRP